MLSRQSRGGRAGAPGVVAPQRHGNRNDRKASDDDGPWLGAEALEPLAVEMDRAKGDRDVDDPAPVHIGAPDPDRDEQHSPSDGEDIIRDMPRRSAPGPPSFRRGIDAAVDPALARIVAPQRADPEPEINEEQRHAGKDQRQAFVGRRHLLRDEIGRRGEQRKRDTVIAGSLTISM